MNDRHVDEEINGVKTLYEGRERNISHERDDALAKVIALQKVKRNLYCIFKNYKLTYCVHPCMSS